jgi:hypothetical protein
MTKPAGAYLDRAEIRTRMDDEKGGHCAQNLCQEGRVFNRENEKLCASGVDNTVPGDSARGSSVRFVCAVH